MKRRFLLLILLGFLAACSYQAPKRDSLTEKYEKFKQELVVSGAAHNKAAHETLMRIPSDKQSRESLLALKLTDRAEILLPEVPYNMRIDVESLLSTNVVVQTKAEKQLAIRTTNDNQKMDDVAVLAERINQAEAKLIAYGTQWEIEHNKKVWWRFWTWSTTTLVIAGIIAACVFFPAIIPIILGLLKRLFGYFVSFIQWVVPALANVVKGIGNFKTQLKTEVEANKTLPPDKQIVYTPAEVLEYLNDELSKATDNQDKVVIERLKKKLNV